MYDVLRRRYFGHARPFVLLVTGLAISLPLLLIACSQSEPSTDAPPAGDSMSAYIDEHNEGFARLLASQPHVPVQTVIYFQDYLTLQEALELLPDGSSAELILYGHGEWRSTFPLPNTVDTRERLVLWQQHLQAEAATQSSRTFETIRTRNTHAAFLQAIRADQPRVVFGVVGAFSPRSLEPRRPTYWFAAPLAHREPWVLFNGPRSAYRLP